MTHNSPIVTTRLSCPFCHPQINILAWCVRTYKCDYMGKCVAWEELSFNSVRLHVATEAAREFLLVTELSERSFCARWRRERLMERYPRASLLKIVRRQSFALKICLCRLHKPPPTCASLGVIKHSLSIRVEHARSISWLRARHRGRHCRPHPAFLDMKCI